MKSDIYKIEEFDAYRAEGFYQLPILKKENYIPPCDVVYFKNHVIDRLKKVSKNGR